ncbi:uncharacterized protein [Oryza sativa Japonica Group]
MGPTCQLATSSPSPLLSLSLPSLSLFSFGQAAGEDVGDSAGCCLRRGGVGEDEGVGGRRRAVRWRGDTGEGALRGSPAWGTTTAWRTSSSIRTRISVSSASSGSSTPVAASDSNNSAMPSDLTVSRASEWRATLAMSSRSGWIEAVVVGRAAQGAPVQPAAIGAGEGAATAPELRRRVRQPRRRGRPTSARRWSASWWAKRTRASYSGMARTGGSGTPGCSSGRRAWRWPGSPACLQSAPPRLVRRTQPPSPRTSTPGSRSSTQAEWDDGAVGGVGGGGSAPAPGARQAVPEEVGDDPIGGVGVVVRVPEDERLAVAAGPRVRQAQAPHRHAHRRPTVAASACDSDCPPASRPTPTPTPSTGSSSFHATR